MAATRTYQTVSGYAQNASGAPAENHISNYWRQRIATMLEKLETEARRMFQLEAELSEFATQYYNAVGSVTERLAEVEERIASSEPSAQTISYSMPEIMATRDAHETRKRELKTRYRTLAKEIHPDRAGITTGIGIRAGHMQALNTAYHHGDLAGMLKIEAEMLIAGLVETDFSDVAAIENALRELDRAAETYAQGYRAMLNSPINELMLRAMSARLAGWDWMQAVVKKVERTIEEKERAMIEASIAQISQWRAEVQAVA